MTVELFLSSRTPAWKTQHISMQNSDLVEQQFSRKSPQKWHLPSKWSHQGFWEPVLTLWESSLILCGENPGSSCGLYIPGIVAHHLPGLTVKNAPPHTSRITQTQRPSSQWYHPAISFSVVPFSSCPQSLPASVFSNESTLRMRWPKYWSFSFSISLSKEWCYSWNSSTLRMY